MAQQQLIAAGYLDDDGKPSTELKNITHTNRFICELRKRLSVPSPAAHLFALMTSVSTVFPNVTEDQIDMIGDVYKQTISSYVGLKDLEKIMYETMSKTKTIVTTAKIQNSLRKPTIPKKIKARKAAEKKIKQEPMDDDDDNDDESPLVITEME